MVRKRLSPGMQNGHSSSFCAQKLRVSACILQGLRGGIEQQFVTQALVDVKKRVQQVWYREHNVKIPAGNKPSFKFVHPLFLFQKLTFRAIAVMARVVCLLFIPAMIARVYMSPQMGCPATGNVVESFLLLMAQMAALQKIFWATMKNGSNFCCFSFI